MFYLETILIAISLSMDALAVSITNGYLIKSLKIRHAFRIAFFFGFFQAIMPLLGWALGINIAKYFQKFDHFIAFGILLFLGIKMILSSRKLELEACPVDEKKLSNNKKTCLDFSFLILMSIATSIDAFAVGISFAILKVLIFIPILIIGLITFIICFIGVFIGNKIGHLFENKLEIAGGVILILIGLKIFVEHIVKNI
ncbi:MAG: manganese efflux pump MntP family protein [Spirochaetes bacterium]|nr:manganese efflux pump MntP family protein [Spirochaetota bacterium]